MSPQDNPEPGASMPKHDSASARLERAGRKVLKDVSAQSFSAGASREATDLARWAEISSLGEISQRCASLLKENSGSKGDVALQCLGAAGMTMAIYHDPSFPTFAAKRAQLVRMLDIRTKLREVGSVDRAQDQRGDVWGQFQVIIGTAIRGDMIGSNNPLYSGSMSLKAVTTALFGDDFVQGISEQSARKYQAEAAFSGLSDEAKAAVQNLQNRMVQARLREEIFREFPDMYQDFQSMMESDDPIDYLVDPHASQARSVERHRSRMAA